MVTLTLTTIERDFLLAALRLWQEVYLQCAGDMPEDLVAIAEDHQYPEDEPLWADMEALDNLAEDINVREDLHE